jgi:hypothetical protein
LHNAFSQVIITCLTRIRITPPKGFPLNAGALCSTSMQSARRPNGIYDFSSLFLFSFLFSRSTLFLCIVSASFSYRAFSSFAARLSLIACILLCKVNVSVFSCHRHYQVVLVEWLKPDPATAYLSFGFLLLLHFLLLCLYCSNGFSLLCALLVSRIASLGPESATGCMPLFPCKMVSKTFQENSQYG